MNATDPARTRLQITIVALGVLLLGLTPYPRGYTQAMHQAAQHQANREYGAALKAYGQAAQFDPDTALPWLRMGEVLNTQHRFTEAAIALREAEHLGSSADVLLALGQSYAGRSDWAQARHIWLGALALGPDDARVYLALGRAALAQGQFEHAKQDLITALGIEPGGDWASQAHALLGRIRLFDQPEQAQAHARQAHDADLQTLIDAVHDEVDPVQRDLTLGVAFLQREALSLARRHLERAVMASEGDAIALAYLAHCLDRQGETVQASQLLDQALAQDDGSPLVYYFLAAHERQVGNLARAQEALWQAVTLDPENAALYAEMGETFVQSGDYVTAEEWIQAAVDRTPNALDFHLLRAHFYLDHLYRVQEGGIPAAEAAVALAPQDARAVDLLGWGYHLSGQHVQASQTLHQALALDPDLVSAHYHLGSLYATIGEIDLARNYLQRASDLDIGGYYRDRAEAQLASLP